MVLLDELAGYEQPESRTLGSFGAEKGGKELCLDTVGHAGTIVRNFEPDGCISFECRQDTDFMFFIDVVIVGTCINGIGYQVEQALVNRVRIHADFTDGRGEIFNDANVMGLRRFRYEFTDIIGDTVRETILVLGLSFF